MSFSSAGLKPSLTAWRSSRLWRWQRLTTGKSTCSRTGIDGHLLDTKRLYQGGHTLLTFLSGTRQNAIVTCRSHNLLLGDPTCLGFEIDIAFGQEPLLPVVDVRLVVV